MRVIKKGEKDFVEIVKKAAAGTIESSDAYVEVEPGTDGVQIRIDSVVKQQFGDAIEAVAKSVLEEYEVKNAVVKVLDRGALDCVIRARLETALLRGKEAR